MTNAALVESRSDVLTALRSLEGRGTVGDVVAASGLPRDSVESSLRGLLETLKGHLDVSESGELVYQFDKNLIRRDAIPLLQRVRRTAGVFLSKAFKVWIVGTLTVYFALFVALIVAALVAMLSRGDDRRGGGFGGRRRPGLPSGNFWLWYYLWTPRWRLGRPYYGRRWERTLPKEDKVPFYKKVFAFVFGPDRPHPDQKQLDRGALRLIRSRSGVVTTAELVQHTGLPLPAAEEEMARLTGSYAGQPTVSNDGEVVYAFPELMTSAHGRVEVREPNPAWKRLEYPLEVTGNSKKEDALIVGMNGFNLIAGATAPLFIFPQLGIGGMAAFIGLVLVPVVFSVLFFGVPLVRSYTVARENRARETRNVRKVLLGLVYERALKSGSGVTVEDAQRYVTSRLKDQVVSEEAIAAGLHDLASEFDADVAADSRGGLVFQFPAVYRQFAASEAIRSRLQLAERTLGEIVYSSGDTPAEAGQREMADFDRRLEEARRDAGALEAGDLDVGRYLPTSDRVDFEDDYEIVAFDEELAQRRVGA